MVSVDILIVEPNCHVLYIVRHSPSATLESLNSTKQNGSRG